MPAGRPPKYNTPEEMQEIIDAYFVKCDTVEEDKNPTFPSMAGLAYELGFTTQALRDYAKKDEFLCTVKEARQRVEMAWEQRLLAPGSGPIFWLKNNAGWKDKTEQELTGKEGGPIQTASVINFIPVSRENKDDT
jgi:hypothetical protein